MSGRSAFHGARPCEGPRRLPSAELNVRIHSGPAVNPCKPAPPWWDRMDFANDCPLASLCSVEMAGDGALWGDILTHRRFMHALRHGMRATRMETAARRRIERARNLAGDRQLLVPVVGVRRQGCGKLMHLLRIIFGWSVEIGGLSIPFWASWLGVLVAGALAY